MDHGATKTNLYIIVPALNEAENLNTLFASFNTLNIELGEDHQLQFILVDDGSTDETAAMAKKLAAGLRFELLQHTVNQGPGRAFATAFEYLAPLLRPDDWVVTMEGDNTSRYELLQKMFTRIREGYDVVLASPYMYGGGITNTSTQRIVLSHVANAFLKEFIGIHGIHTMSSFFRLYRGAVIIKLQMYYGTGIIERAGFESMIELLLKLIHVKCTISEVPMLLDTSRRQGKSKMKIMKTIRGYLALWMIKSRWLQPDLT